MCAAAPQDFEFLPIYLNDSSCSSIDFRLVSVSLGNLSLVPITLVKCS